MKWDDRAEGSFNQNQNTDLSIFYLFIFLKKEIMLEDK